MEIYSQFARVYDRLMGDVDYRARAGYLLKLFDRFGKRPTLLLDLACGTGGFSNELALKGIEVIGVDMSEEMLLAARENSARLATDVLFLCQRAEELDLYGTVDGAICCMDSLNHITDLRKLKKAISRVSLFLEKDCLFIFDVNTVYKHREVLGDNSFVIEEDGVYCVWQNMLDEKSLTTDISLDFFVENGEVYERYSEDFSERAYTDEQLRQIISECDFDIEAVFGDMTLQPPEDSCERTVWILKKRGEEAWESL